MNDKKIYYHARMAIFRDAVFETLHGLAAYLQQFNDETVEIDPNDFQPSRRDCQICSVKTKELLDYPIDHPTAQPLSKKEWDEINAILRRRAALRLDMIEE